MGSYQLYIAACAPDGGVYRFTLSDGRLAFGEKTPCDSPMYLDAARGSLLAILKKPFAGNDESALVEYALDASGRPLRAGQALPTRGVEACHLCRYQGDVFVTNYVSGSVFSASGKLDTHAGKGVDPRRQDAAHTHFIAPAPDGTCLLSTDLGLDAVYSYDRDLRVLGVARVPAGHGARHLAYLGDIVFCANELASTVTVFRWRDGALTPLETVSVLNRDVPNTVAAIRVRGEYVYVSNRGDDSISCLRWDGDRLTLRSVTPCGGASPRDFLIVEDQLFCANERSDDVTLLRVDGETLENTGVRLTMPRPLCVVALPDAR